MKALSYISLTLTLALAFCLWLPDNPGFIIALFSTYIWPLLLIGDILALVYILKHRKERSIQGLVGLVIAIPIIAAIGYFAPWHSTSDKTMSRHFHKHENDLRELVQYAESLTDSTSISVSARSDVIGITEEQFDQVSALLKKSGCKSIKTYGVLEKNTVVVFRTSGFTIHGYIFLPDRSIKIVHWDPLGSDGNGLYDISE